MAPTRCAVANEGGLRAPRAEVPGLFGAEPFLKTGYRFVPAKWCSLATTHHASKARSCDATVDNGIAQVEGVAAAQAVGIEVVNHRPCIYPAMKLPMPWAIVKSKPGPVWVFSKNLPGVGVIFNVLLASRAQLRSRDHFQGHPQPKLDNLVYLVGLWAAVRDCRQTPTPTNRLLVSRGLQRINRRPQPVFRALYAVSGRDTHQADPLTLGFTLGPRSNAAVA